MVHRKWRIFRGHVQVCLNWTTHGADDKIRYCFRMRCLATSSQHRSRVAVYSGKRIMEFARRKLQMRLWGGFSTHAHTPRIYAIVARKSAAAAITFPSATWRFPGWPCHKLCLDRCIHRWLAQQNELHTGAHHKRPPTLNLKAKPNAIRKPVTVVMSNVGLCSSNLS